MSVKALRWGKSVGVGAIIAVAASALTVVGESKLAPSGSFRVEMIGGSPTVDLPHMATFVPDGGVIASTIPVGCLLPGQTMSEGHGQWSFSMQRGTPMLKFHILADLYTRGGKSPNGFTETTYDGSVSVDAAVPVLSGDAVRGVATLTFPAGHPCASQFNGPVAFAAKPASAEPPPSPKGN
jgi:hypothetical protein